METKKRTILSGMTLSPKDRLSIWETARKAWRKRPLKEINRELKKLRKSWDRPLP